MLADYPLPAGTTDAIGLCLGACSISTAWRRNGQIVLRSIPHAGKVAEVLECTLSHALPARVGITGRAFRNLVTLSTIAEPEAIELAYEAVRESCPDIDCIVSAGGETFLAYVLDSKGRIRSVHTGNKCASGTGEFFLQQIKRMDLGIEEAIATAVGAAPYPLAGRCSVFCKSDCTHALNKGTDKRRVSAGLCQVMAGKIIELLKKARPRNVLVIGGVSNNQAVMEVLREFHAATCTVEQSPCFEALGALLWAEQHDQVVTTTDNLIKKSASSFTFLPKLVEGMTRVHFSAMQQGTWCDGDYILGLDVGSTTTKAVLMHSETNTVAASVYLRTAGDPIGASRRCYQEILRQIPADVSLHIIGLGTTGSGRQIAGLHAGTNGVINEIVAHAAAAVFFDPAVETIFEIGGQDAKYTCITNRVASDYAMNEACSAGTGSFLEEACRESLGIDTEAIEAIALRSAAAPNFSDQCSAFVGSDIKTAVQEGIATEDIVAGLVYSVCQNYLNRVKGSRPVGRKIFMQGGVCYNKAVPAAMAALCDREIIVPPEPGLMGAFGVALEVRHKIQTGLLAPASYNLKELADRQVVYREPFICAGGTDHCDRKCTIARIEVHGVVHPFGGACDLYYNLLRNRPMDTTGLDLVKFRETLVFSPPATQRDAPAASVSIGIPASLMTTTLYPFYGAFFSSLGLRVVPGLEVDPNGMEMAGAAFCFPVMQSHAFLLGLLHQSVDYIFVPMVKSLAMDTEGATNCTCPFVQAEPSYLQAAFHDELQPKLLTAVLAFDKPEQLRKSFTTLGRRLGYSRPQIMSALDEAHRVFAGLISAMHEQGRSFLGTLDPDETAIVLFGRPYNAFSQAGNMGIPHKFASRGYRIVPHDFLPPELLSNTITDQMYWASGQGILRAAEFVRRHPRLFAVYVSNFSCGPDSFLTGYFRSTMGRKPSLTLEIDAHTADAGIDTRIEAFLDVIKGYQDRHPDCPDAGDFTPARMLVRDNVHLIETGSGQRYRLTDPQVSLILPSMGDAVSSCLAAAMRYVGIRAKALPPPGPTELAKGKAHATCKECLPLLLTTGSLAHYLEEHRPEGEITVYFMPETNGPCRFGQYSVFMKHYIRRNRIADVAIYSPSSENSYAGMPAGLARRSWVGVTIGDGLEEIRAAIMTLAEDSEQALAVFEQASARIVASIAKDPYSTLLKILRREMAGLATLAKKYSLGASTRITLVGEIFVRRDGFSRQYLAERFAKQGVLLRTAPVTEWLYYTVACSAKGLNGPVSLKNRLSLRLQQMAMTWEERRIARILASSGFHDGHAVHIRHLLDKGATLLTPELTGEAILTVSSALTELGDTTHGVISIGPFGCMPCRIAESIISFRLTDEKANFSRGRGTFWATEGEQLPLPFLAIESDGTPFPQLVETRLESLLLSAERLKKELGTLHG
jgi:predicted CoA-substrate-specific enzyme activase